MKNANGVLIINTIQLFLTWAENQPECGVEFVI